MSVESNPGLNWFCFTVLFDWSRKLAPPSQPIRCKLKPIAPWSLAFSRATGRLHAFTSSCHWLPLIISFTLIGRCDYFGFGFRHSIEKRSNRKLSVIELLGNLPELLRVSETFRPTNSEICLKKGISWEAAIQQFAAILRLVALRSI